MYRILDIIYKLTYNIRRRIHHGKILSHDLTLSSTNEHHYHICLVRHLFPRKNDFEKISMSCCSFLKLKDNTSYSPNECCEMCKYFATVWFEKEAMKIMCSNEVVLKREDHR